MHRRRAEGTRRRRQLARSALGASVLAAVLAVGPAPTPASAGPTGPLGVEESGIEKAIVEKGGSMVDCTVPNPGPPSGPSTPGTTPPQPKEAKAPASKTIEPARGTESGGPRGGDGGGDPEGGRGPVGGGGTCSYRGPTPGTTERGTNPITDAIGLRFDQRALDEVSPQMGAPVKTALIAQLQESGEENAPLGDFPLESTIASTGPVTVTGDFRGPDGGFPNGSLAVHVDVQDPEIAYAVDPLLWADCHIWIRPGDFTIDAVATYDATAAVPVTVVSVDTNLDMNPQGNISTSGMCWTYLVDNVISSIATDIFHFVTFHIWDNPSDPVGELKTTLLDQLNSAIGGATTGSMLPAMVGPFGGPGGTIADIRSDDEGLKVKVDVDPAVIPNLLLSPGQPVEAGTASDLDDVLAQRDTTGGLGIDVSAVIDPNFVNLVLAHFANAKTFNFQFDLEEDALLASGLLKSGSAGSYPDDRWTVQFLENQVPFLTAVPHTPSGEGWDIQSRLTIPGAELSVRNDGVEVARLRFTVSGIGVGMQTHLTTGRWGPAADLDGATVSGVSVLFANADIAGSGAVAFVSSKVDQAAAWLDGLSFSPPQLAGYILVARFDKGSLAGDDRVTGLFDLEVGPTARLHGSVGSWKPPKKIDGHWHFYPSYTFTGTTTGLTNVTWTFTNPQGTFATWTITGDTIVIDTEGFCGYGGSGSVNAHVTGTYASSAGPLVVDDDLYGTESFDPNDTGLCGGPP